MKQDLGIEAKLLIKVETMIKRLERMEELLKQALPYVTAHFERSRTGFGGSAQILMNQIKAVLGLK